MSLEIVTIPCLKDNYAYLVNGPDGTCLIDAPEAAPIIAALDARGWKLGSLLITHHHHDHVGGVEELRAKYGCEVIGPKAEADKLPPLDLALEDGATGGTGEALTVAIAVPGHTLGHLAGQIIAGNVEIRPYKMGTASACPTCQYKDVCRFDPAINAYRHIPPAGREAILTRLSQGADEPD
jgi:hypothetical protein